MKPLKKLFVIPTLTCGLVCFGVVLVSSCGSNRGSATEIHYPGNTLDEPQVPVHSEEGAHPNQEHAKQPGENPEEKREQHSSSTQKAPDSTHGAHADTVEHTDTTAKE